MNEEQTQRLEMILQNLDSAEKLEPGEKRERQMIAALEALGQFNAQLDDKDLEVQVEVHFKPQWSGPSALFKHNAKSLVNSKTTDKIRIKYNSNQKILTK